MGLCWKHPILLLVIVSILISCQRNGEGRLTGKSIEDVLKEYTPQLMSIDGVVGTAIGECRGQPCIKVLVVQKTPELQTRIPPMLETFEVQIEETGEVRAR